GYCNPRHLKPVSHRRSFPALVGRLTGDHEPDAVERAALAALLSQNQMAEVNWIKRAPEQSQSHQQKTPLLLLARSQNHSFQRDELLWTSVQKLGEVRREPL